MRKSISETDFMVKFNFFKDKNIPQYSVVRIVAISNMACLIEDTKTFERAWVMRYDIYPLDNYDLSGYWEFSQIYDDIAKANGLK
jgi:hypothetical protein